MAVSLGNWKKVEAGLISLGKKLNKNFSKEISPVIVSLSGLKKDISNIKEDYRKAYYNPELSVEKLKKRVRITCMFCTLPDKFDSIDWTDKDMARLCYIYDMKELKKSFQQILDDMGKNTTVEGVMNEANKLCNFDLSKYKRTDEDRASIIKEYFDGNSPQMQKVKDKLMKTTENDVNGIYIGTIKGLRSLIAEYRSKCNELENKKKNFNSVSEKIRENYASHKKTCEQYLRKNKINILPQAKAEYKFIKETLLPYINGRIEKLSDANIQAFLKEPPAKKEKGE